MPTFRPPHSVISEDKDEAIRQLGENLTDLINNYNQVLADLDAEVFYHIIPMVNTEAVETTGTFTQTDRVIVVIEDIQYYLSLDKV